MGLKGIVAPDGTIYHFDHEYLENNPNIPALDTGLDTVGAAADSAAVGGAVGDLNNSLSELSGLVNYDYDTPYYSEPNPSGSAYQAVGISRNFTKIVLNGTVPESENVRIKISGNVSRVASSASVDGWQGIELIDGHKYAVKCEHVGGTMDGIYVSVYKEGTHNTIGEFTYDGRTFIRTFDADGSRYVISLYLYEEYTYTDAAFIVTLTDMTASKIESLSLDVDTVEQGVSGIREELDLLYDEGNMSGMFSQGGYSRAGNRLTGNYAASNIYTPNFLPENIVRIKVDDPYVFMMSAFDSNGSWAGFLVDDYTFSTVSTDTWLPKTDILLSKYRKLYPAYNYRVQVKNNSGSFIAISPEEASDFTVYYGAEKDGSIKDYYRDEMATTIASVRESITEPALVFPLVTDIHYQSVNDFFDDCADNIKYLTSRIKCDFILNLGDDTDGNAAQEVTLARAYHMRDRFAEIDLPYYHAMGNHDTNYYQSSPKFNSDQIFSAYFSNTRGVKYNLMLGEKDFYKDFDDLGIRLIVLDGNHDGAYRFSANAAAWLENTALDTDYIVVIGVHFSPIKEQNWSSKAMTNAPDVAAAIQAFVNNGGTVIQFCGHSHADYHYDTPWLSIHNNCQKFMIEDLTTSGYATIAENTDDLESPAREAGTATEDCWSVVVIKPLSRTVDLIRFGAGDDRTFDF